MIKVVVDASTALAWCFPDEGSDYADNVLVALEGKTILVPAIWSLEIANAVLVGERRKRLNNSQIRQFTGLLARLPLIEDIQSTSERFEKVLPLARKCNLSAYDAAYLELSIRHGAPIATLDKRIAEAASRVGARVFLR